MQVKNNPPIIIFTDLDGTLLDHDTYGFDDAQPALDLLDANDIPVVLSSSKTLAEMIHLRKALQNIHPFISENGSVIAIPNNYFPMMTRPLPKPDENDGLHLEYPGGDRRSLLSILHHIRDDNGYYFTGFDDMTIEQLAHETGLALPQAELAKERISTEPIKWQDTPDQWQRFTTQLSEQGLAWVQGGRFLSISRPFDKKDGIKRLLDLYNQDLHSHCLTIGLGDSPNDQGMLAMMDIAVIIRSKQSETIALKQPKKIIKTVKKGPKGWQEAMDMIFSDHFNPINKT